MAHVIFLGNCRVGMQNDMRPAPNAHVILETHTVGGGYQGGEAPLRGDLTLLVLWKGCDLRAMLSKSKTAISG